MVQILALVPAYNEQAHIEHVVCSAAAHLPVLVVDDGSTDRTAQVAEEAGATVIRQQPNQGKGAALRAGFRHALNAGCDAVITLDADGQHAPDEIPVFVEAYEAHVADLIIGARDFALMPTIRRAANTIGTWAFSWAMGQAIRDNQSGYRLISQRLMEATLESEESGFEFEVEMIVVCIQNEYRLAWVPIRTIYAGESSHIRPLQHARDFVRIVLQTRRRIKRGWH